MMVSIGGALAMVLAGVTVTFIATNLYWGERMKKEGSEWMRIYIRSEKAWIKKIEELTKEETDEENTM